MNRQVSQRGFSLVELMVSMLVGMILLAGVTGVAVGGIRASNDNLKAARLNQELRTTMDVLVRDIRRADSGSGLPTDTDDHPYPITLSATEADGPLDQINYTYDQDLDGVFDDPAEKFGLRLNGTTQAVEILRNGTWTQVTDSSVIEVTNLEFCFWTSAVDADDCPETPPQSAGSNNGTKPEMIVRTIRITLAGRLKNDTVVQRGFTETVRVRNDAYDD